MTYILQHIPALCARGAVLLALGAWGGAFSPLLDGLNHFAPIWLLLSFCAGLACILSGARGWAAYCLVAALAHAAIMAPEFMRPMSSPAPASSERTIRVVWLNTWMGSRPTEEVLRYLETSGADFVLVSELHDEGQEGFQRLRAAYPTMIRCAGGHECNTMIFAKRPALTQQTNVGLRASIGEFDVDGARLRLIAAHLARPNPPAGQQREFRALTEAVGDAPQDVILAGDFNSTPWSFSLRRFDAASGLQRHTRAMATWPAQPWTRLQLPALVAFLPIDHVYSGSRWRLVSLRRGPRTSSDHYPIEATFTAD